MYECRRAHTDAGRDGAWKRLLSVVVAAAGLLLLSTSAAVAPAGGSGAAVRWPKPRTLLMVPSIEGFAQDGDRVVWADSSRSCRGLVQLRNLKTRVTTPLLGRSGPTCAVDRQVGGGFQWQMALAGKRALWAYVTASNAAFHFTIATAAPGTRERKLRDVHIEGGVGEQDLYRPVPLGGDGRTLVFGDISDAEEQDPVGVFRVRPGAALVPGTYDPQGVAVAGDRFADARHRAEGCVCNLGPAWSPDGTRIAFLGQRRAGNRALELYVLDSHRTVHELVGASVLRGFDWTPDGTAIVYGVLGQRGLSVVDMAGAARKVVSEAVEPTWDKYAPRTAYMAHRTPSVAYVSGNRLRVVSITTGEVRTVAAVSRRIEEIAWSPADRSIAYVVETKAGYALRVVAAGGGKPVTVASYGDSFQGFLQWTPDGSGLTLVVGKASKAIHVVPVEGGAKRALVQGVDRLEPVGWSPDGRWFAFMTNFGSWLQVVSADGGPPRTIADHLTSTTDAVWAPDSSALALGPPDWDNDVNIQLAFPDGAPQRSLVDGQSQAWSPDGQRLAYLLPAERGGREIATVDRDGTDAVTWTRTDPEPASDPVELRDWKTGSLLTTFDAGAPVLALALRGDRVAVLVRTAAGKRIDIRGTDGALIRRVAVAKGVANELSMTERWVVFRAGRSIRVLEVTSGPPSQLVRAGGTVVGLSIDGRRVAWGEQRSGQSDAIRAVVLPR